jgi:NAD(P)-dependent dehydrogenase (short-subunit alcohol dehydrogenase family)
VNVNKFGLDADGIDRHMGVNWFGHYYLLNLLYPLIRKTSKMPGVPAPRIIWESSELHRQAPKNMHFGSMAEINDDSLSPIEVRRLLLQSRACLCRRG